MDMHELRRKHRQAIDAAEELVYRSQAEKRELSDAEVADVRRLTAEAKSWKDRISTRESEERFLSSPIARIHAIGASSSGKSYLPPGAKGRDDSWSKAVLAKHEPGFKSGLAYSGSVLTPTAFDPTVVVEGQLPATLRALLPMTTLSAGDHYAFLRQKTRDNQASSVQRGGLKPTSNYDIERVEDRVRVVAHISSPIVRADLDDAATLAQFVDAEMRYGLIQAEEDMILNADSDTSGGKDDGVGFLRTSGLSVQPYSTAAGETGPDPLIVTTRKALTAQAALGNTPTAWVLSPADWERFELLVDLQDRPISNVTGYLDPVGRRLWGLPVVTSVHLAQGTALLGDFAGSARIYVREEAVLSWSEHLYYPDLLGEGSGASLFSTNQVVARAESRLGLAVLRPSAFSKVSLTAPPPTGG